MKCEYDINKICEESKECQARFVACDKCEFIDQEGDCDNSDSPNRFRFMDGLSTCCSLFKKKSNS